MKPKSQFTLLAQRRFAPFFWTQFLGALNDNVFKTALVTILTFDALNWTTMPVDMLNQIIPGLFILPFVLFSASAGQIADKVEKGRLARSVKLLEIAIMCVAAFGWFEHQVWLLIAAVAGMGLHSTLFGPMKYAYLPQHLKRDELIGGNGVVEMGTFVGILLGEIIGAVLVVHQGWGIHLVAFGSIGLAVLGALMSWNIPASPAPVPELKINWNPFTETWRNIQFSRKNRPVFMAQLGNSWFWFYGAIVLAQFPQYAKVYLHGDHSVFVLLLAFFSIGVGAGSLWCERLSGHKIEIGLVPLGAIGLSIFGIDLYFSSIAYVNQVGVDMFQFLQQAGSWHIVADVVLIGVFGGLYIVPLFALIQTRCDPAHISRTIAGVNILNALFMVIASLAAMVMLKMGLTIPQLFFVTACLNAVMALYIFTQVPEFLMRFLVWLLTHTIHRARGIDLERIPEAGPALLVCDQANYLDALVILACARRPVRFAINSPIVNRPLLAWIFTTARAISGGSAEIASALQQGGLVCIVLESNPASEAGFTGFNDGVQKLLEQIPVPVIPLAQRKLGQGFFSRLEMLVGASMAQAHVTPENLQKQLQLLRNPV